MSGASGTVVRKTIGADRDMRKFTLNQRIVDYIRGELQQGRTLSRYLLELPLEQGQVFAYLPDDTPVEMANEVDILHPYIIGAEVAKLQLSSFLSAQLRARENALVVFENAVAWSTDANYGPSSRHQFFSFGREVYNFLVPDDAESEKVMATIRATIAYPFIGVITSLPEYRPRLQVSERVEEALLIELADRAEHIVIGAYDNQAQIIWSR